MSQVLRTFGHNDGYGTTMPVSTPIQPTVGVFSEAALQRYDFVMDAFAKVATHSTPKNLKCKCDMNFSP